ncbi:MAG: AAA family ATPase [Candidatus Marsarchaeota archaeon]|nr:AAA family ATPase [Candidatus Marsarchaeota archaeon]
MVDKIISIKNVGPFLKYAPKGDVQFRRVTLIYAENGRGKTTLSAILASLKTGDGTRIVERSRLGLPAGLGTGAGPEVEIRLHNNSTATFHEGIWSQVRSDIEVFDSAFVNDNVYAGHFVDIEHRRNLYRFVVGEEGVKLTQQVDGYDEAIKTPTTNIRAIEDAIRPLIKGGLPLEQFVSLKLSTDIEGKIRSKEVELQALKKATELLSKPSLERLQYAQNPDIGVRALLLQSLQDVSARAEGIVQQHLRQLSVDGAEAWVQQGVRHAEATERCPFCDQPMAGTELLKAFSDYFNSEYLKLKADITALDTEIRSLLSEDRLLSVQKAIVSNESLAVYWSEYVAAEYPSAAFDDLHGAWGRVRELLSQHLARKTDSPLEAISPSPELEAALVAYATQAVGMAGYNRTLEAVNDKIAAKRTEIQRQQISSVQNELDLLLNIKRRHDSDVDALCVLLRTHQETKKRLDSEKKAAKRSLDDYVANVFDQYEAGINLYLQQCGASFRIAAPKTSYAGGKPSSTYGLSINGEVIDLGDSKSRGKPCFRTALSEGDKSGLAFAFFLARLDQDNELADKTVVFDDHWFEHNSLNPYYASASRTFAPKTTNRAVHFYYMQDVNLRLGFSFGTNRQTKHTVHNDNNHNQKLTVKLNECFVLLL